MPKVSLVTRALTMQISTASIDRFSTTEQELTCDDLSFLIKNKLTLSEHDLVSPHVPFKIIEFMVTKLPQIFVEQAMYLTSGYFPREVFPTSCIHNLHAMAIIFFGSDLAKSIMNRLGLNYRLAVNIEFDSIPNNPYQVIIKNLFSGPMVQIFAKELPDSQYTKEQKERMYTKYAPSVAQSFFDSLEAEAVRCSQIQASSNDEKINKVFNSFKEALSNIDYDFNRQTIDFLRKEIQDNEKQINQETSFVYSIAVAVPVDTGNGYYHAFAVEQLYHARSACVGYRFYQTWLNQMDLATFFRNKEYSSDGNGIWSLQEVCKFIDDLEIIFTKTPFDASQRNEAHKRAFGFDNELSDSLYWVHANKPVLKGISFRYLSQKINPNDSLKNLLTFIKSDPELEKKARLVLK